MLDLFFHGPFVFLYQHWPLVWIPFLFPWKVQRAVSSPSSKPSLTQPFPSWGKPSTFSCPSQKQLHLPLNLSSHYLSLFPVQSVFLDRDNGPLCSFSKWGFRSGTTKSVSIALRMPFLTFLSPHSTWLPSTGNEEHDDFSTPSLISNCS